MVDRTWRPVTGLHPCVLRGAGARRRQKRIRSDIGRRALNQPEELTLPMLIAFATPGHLLAPAEEDLGITEA